ncbi:hypothetical protein V8D89_009451 [Ganoderma adspersum]
MSFIQPFDDAFRQEVAAITQDSTRSDAALHEDAARHLRVLANPSFADVDQPAWVRRIQQFTWMWIMYTSSGLFSALYQTADQLGFAEGSATSPPPSDRDRCVAEALAKLATAWTAHFLWPYFVDGTKSASEVLAKRISLRLGLFQSLTSESTVTTPQGDNDRRLVSKEDLLKRSRYVCCMTVCVHIRAPREFFDGPGSVAVSDLQVAHIFRPPRALRERGMRPDDEVITVDILKHYCHGRISVDPDSVEATQGATPSLIEPRNALVLERNTCAAFHSFKWCLHPSREQVANEYYVEVHERNWLGVEYVASQDNVTFEDHSHQFTADSKWSIDLPDAELLRVHAALAGVLQLSEVLTAFQAIVFECEGLDAEECEREHVLAVCGRV